MSVKRAQLLITGRVQGVGYRYSAVIRANQHGVAGWVRNTREGHVEIMAEGPADDLEGFIEWCRRGPSAAWVQDVHVDWQPPTGEFSSFDLRY
jgi:acylphosphatase